MMLILKIENLAGHEILLNNRQRVGLDLSGKRGIERNLALRSRSLILEIGRRHVKTCVRVFRTETHRHVLPQLASE